MMDMIVMFAGLNQTFNCKFNTSSIYPEYLILFKRGYMKNPTPTAEPMQSNTMKSDKNKSDANKT